LPQKKTKKLQFFLYLNSFPFEIYPRTRTGKLEVRPFSFFSAAKNVFPFLPGTRHFIFLFVVFFSGPFMLAVCWYSLLLVFCFDLYILLFQKHKKCILFFVSEQ
jgi:hypothetical protein